MRNYSLATFNMDAWKDGYMVPECWAFFSIGNQEEAIHMGRLLDLRPRPWIKKKEWAVGFDIVAATAHNFIAEVRAKRWELQQLGVTWHWSRDLIPEAPDESMEHAFMNTFATEEEFNQSLIAPIDIRNRLHDAAPITPIIHDPSANESGHLPLPDSVRLGRVVSDPSLRSPRTGFSGASDHDPELAP